MEPIKLENMTFAELDGFVNEWILKTKDFQEVFVNQTDECGRLFKINRCSDGKCILLQNRINYLTYWYNLIENILSIVGCYMETFEKSVLQLEEKTKRLYQNDVVVDCHRVRIYDICLEINRLINTSYSKLDELVDRTVKSERAVVADNTAELVAKILMNQLYQLERVEQKTQTALNQMSCNDCKLRRCRCLYAAQTVSKYKSK